MRNFVVLAVCAATFGFITSATAGETRGKVPESWTGYYAGVNVGYGWGNAPSDLSYIGPGILGIGTILLGNQIPSSLNTNSKGVLGGLEIGYNYQIGQTVLGAEADFSFSGIRGAPTSDSGTAPVNAIYHTTQSQRISWLSTVRARAGYLFSPTFLLYGTGGLAFGKVSASTTTTVTTAPGGIAAECSLPGGGGNVACTIGSGSQIKAGWTLGAGVETKIAKDWTIKAEYLYYDLGRVEYTDQTTEPLVFLGTPIFQTSARFSGNIVRIGLNYQIH